MGRPRQYASATERQRASRQRRREPSEPAAVETPPVETPVADTPRETRWQAACRRIAELEAEVARLKRELAGRVPQVTVTAQRLDQAVPGHCIHGAIYGRCAKLGCAAAGPAPPPKR